MHLMDGMLPRVISIKTVVLIFIVLLPLIFSGLSLSQSTSMNYVSSKEHTVSSINSVLIAGGFQYFDITLTDEAEKICIIIHQGESMPKTDDRSVENYYKWEYDQGCAFDDHTKYFCSICKVWNNHYWYE